MGIWRYEGFGFVARGREKLRCTTQCYGAAQLFLPGRGAMVEPKHPNLENERLFIKLCGYPVDDKGGREGGRWEEGGF